MLSLDKPAASRLYQARPDENDSYENEYHLRVNEISFSYERMYTKTRFKGEANDIRKWPI